MFGHIRVWQDGEVFYTAELQSDYFQKNNAKRDLVQVDTESVEYKEDRKKIYDKEVDYTKTLIAKAEDKNVQDVSNIDLGYAINRVYKEEAKEKFKKDYDNLNKKYENKLSPQEKQFIASQKIWEQRMVREAIKEASLSGATSLRFPTPYTLSVIEKYVSEEVGSMPYEIEGGVNSNNLIKGDVVKMFDKEYIVIYSDDNNIKIVNKKAIENRVVTRDTIKNKFKNLNLADNEIEGIVDIEIQMNGLKIVPTLMDAINEFVENQGGLNSSITEEFGQPKKYNKSTIKDNFNIIDLSETQQTVARKYEEIAEILKKEKPVEVVIDENGFDWYEAKITKEDTQKPVIAFSAKPLGTEDKVYGFYDQLSKEIFLNESLMSSNVLIHEAYHAFKPNVKSATQKGDKTAKILLNEMNRIVDQSGMFNEQAIREGYKQSDKSGVSSSKSQAYAPRQGESENDYVERMREEVEANLLGENSEQYFDKITKENNLTDKQKKSFVNRVKEFIKSFSDWIAKQLNFENLTPEQASKLTTKDVLDRVTTSILQGQYKNSLYEDLSQFNRIKVVDENMQPKLNDAVSQTIRATLQDDESGVVRATLSDLEGLSPNVWNSSPQAVKTLLKNTQEKAIQISLDLKGLENSYDTKSQAEILELIRSLDFVLNNSSEQSLDNFVEIYEDFFNVDKSEQVVIEKVDEKFRNKPLVKLETKDSDYKVFKELGLLKIDKNTYLKTDALKKSLEEVEVFMNANKLTLDESEMSDKVFAEDVSGAEYDADTLKKLINYRKYFGAENIKKETVEVKVPQQIENEDYLKSDFISDIRKLQLENPDNKALQNLKFGEKGIELQNTDEISLAELNYYLETNQDLKNYFLLSRNTNFEIKQEDSIIDERTQIVNGKILPQFQDNFKKINADVIQAQTNEDFIRIGKDNFEIVQGDLFAKLPTNETNFYQTDVEKPMLNVNPREYMSQKSSPEIKIVNKYSQKESEQIDNEIECR
jgi:hypothetical protein